MRLNVKAKIRIRNASFLTCGHLPEGTSLARKVKRTVCIPVLSAILQNRLFATIIVGAAFLQISLNVLGLEGWMCPFRTFLGVPCPGCGLSTACSLLVQGDWNGAVRIHLFAPFIALGLAGLALLCILPSRYYVSAVQKIEQFERTSGIMIILLSVMFIYWGARLPQGV